MSKEILADVDRDQIRIGVLEDRQLVEYYVERTHDERVIGNIYKGKVANVLPGIQAAFVDIGLEKNAFLYIGDLYNFKHNSEDEDVFNAVTKTSIKDVLHVGQEVLGTGCKRVNGQQRGPGVDEYYAAGTVLSIDANSRLYRHFQKDRK